MRLLGRQAASSHVRHHLHGEPVPTSSCKMMCRRASMMARMRLKRCARSSSSRSFCCWLSCIALCSHQHVSCQEDLDS